MFLLRFLSLVAVVSLSFCFFACVLSSSFSLIAQLGFRLVLLSLASANPLSWLLLARAVGFLSLRLGYFTLCWLPCVRVVSPGVFA